MFPQVELSVVAPVYNESLGIKGLLLEWIAYLEVFAKKNPGFTFEICLTDDKSTDDTRQILQDFAEADSRVFLFCHESNYGAGRSLSTAISGARGEYCLVMDADGQFPINNLERLWAYRGPSTAVVGNRVRKHDHLISRLGSRVSNFFFQALLGSKIRDSNCALKLFPTDEFRSFPIRGNRMVYSGEHSYICLSANFQIENVDVMQIQRKFGFSSTKIVKDGISRLMFTCYLAIESRMVKNKIISINSPWGKF
jgi:dolichol-phosphate mannosyltransferase